MTNVLTTDLATGVEVELALVPGNEFARLRVVSEPGGGGGGGTVTTVTGSAPIVVTGPPALTPNVTITAATDVAAGSMSAADKTKLDAYAPSPALLIVQPGGTAGGNVFTSYGPAVVAAANELQGPVTIYFDISQNGGAPISITGASVFTASQVTFAGTFDPQNADLVTVLQFSGGATLVGVNVFQNLAVFNLGLSAVMTLSTGPAATRFIELIFSEMLALGGAPFIHVTANTTLSISAKQNSIVGNGTDGPVITADAGSTVQISLFDVSQLSNTTLGGAGSFSIIKTSDAVFVGTSLGAPTSVSVIPASTQVNYNDGLVPPPLGANTVQGAIDVLKAEIAATVAAVTASAPLTSSGGTTPNIALTTPLTVANGGTGDATLTAHGVVVGNGASAVNVVAPGTEGQVLTSNGAAADPTMQALPTSTVTTFTANGNFTVPAGVTCVLAFGWGGGGGGSGGQTGNTASTTPALAGAGGGGAPASMVAIPVTPGDIWAVVLGSGGVGRAAGSGTNGGSGTDTTFTNPGATIQYTWAGAQGGFASANNGIGGGTKSATGVIVPTVQTGAPCEGGNGGESVTARTPVAGTGGFYPPVSLGQGSPGVGLAGTNAGVTNSGGNGGGAGGNGGGGGPSGASGAGAGGNGGNGNDAGNGTAAGSGGTANANSGCGGGGGGGGGNGSTGGGSGGAGGNGGSGQLIVVTL